MTSDNMLIDPWPLLRNSALGLNDCALRVVVHGRSNGVVPECLCSLMTDLQGQRLAPVQLQALTSNHRPPLLDGPLLLIPLLLWPGAHTRHDIPAIRQHLSSAGVRVTTIPFLGAWPLWWKLVASTLQNQLEHSDVLVHHPLHSGVADRFLVMLAESLNFPLLPFDRWSEHQALHPHARPLPLALAPNRMTEALGRTEGLPSLLEHSLISQGLLNLLVALP
ncbi:DNA mismatch repair protein MutS [Synechococcus sp. M16CYN]|uniref:DNA mismatch repair protein MutS n=1 Tax=Synechococcus sp. M16CYN TaxID=3103139 RepID=UPI00324FD81B